MNYPIPARSRRNLTALTLAAIAIAVAACSGSGTTTSTNPPLARRAGASVPYTWNFETVDNTSQGKNNSRITGINNVEWIVGLNGTDHADYSSWTSVPATTSGYNYESFKLGNNYPTASADGTYISAITNEAEDYEAGTEFVTPSSGPLTCKICAIVYDAYGNASGGGTGYGAPGGCGNASQTCTWTLLQDSNEGRDSCAVTEGEGIGDPEILVGYYETGSSSCGTQAFESYYSYATGETFVNFNVPGAGAHTTEATGTNGEGDVVGTAQLAGSSLITGWYYIDAQYCTGLSFPKSNVNTYPLGLNWQDQIVGYYEGSDSVPHGFLLTDPTDAQNSQNWEEVTFTNSTGGTPPNNNTVVTGINTHHTITGWYTDSSGDYHGFVGICNGGSKGGSCCSTTTCTTTDGAPTEAQVHLRGIQAIRDLLARRPENAQATCTPSARMRREPL
jgi:hypothetical protein